MRSHERIEKRTAPRLPLFLFRVQLECGKSMRKAISKKLRFDVFKRDGFVCAYCGATPPNVVLQVDHIHPVAEGGTNAIDNLITSCQPCNIGKGANVLTNIPTSLKEKASFVAEQEAQIRGYYEIMQEQEQRIDSEMWEIADIIESGSPESGMNRGWLSSIKKFLKSLGFFEVKDAAELARAKFPWGGKKTFLYFCGICHNRMRAE